ncbi:hypothetical protein C1H46_008405 [Malus baccata]|uniref:Aldehyde oxidase/xanthine dehydrogenase second molybdopterin binding domain-containing protein n=1 Tax=Malus baccata TaxID=106549 RepID=A0A540N4L0_MALBA|nr:hypothetical protein C1H46_008405 [Malus baccata]
MFLMQIEGAFVQGLGFVALEVLKGGDPARKWISPGCLYTYGPGSYKIPCINDVPFKFSVSLLKGHPNVKVIHSSKVLVRHQFSWHPPSFFTIKDAIIAAKTKIIEPFVSTVVHAVALSGHETPPYYSKSPSSPLPGVYTSPPPPPSIRDMNMSVGLTARDSELFRYEHVGILFGYVDLC